MYGNAPYMSPMPPFKDHSSAIDESRSARMEQRMKPRVKAEIQKAASLLGVDETTFVVGAALERARQTILDHEHTMLTPKDRDVFLAALDASAKPTRALRNAVAVNRRLIRHGG